VSHKLRDYLGFLRFVLKRWSDDRCPQIAGSLTYISLLAIFPIFAVVVALLAQSPIFEDVMSSIKIWLLLNFVPEIAGKIITVYMADLTQHAAKLTFFGLGVVLVLAVWTMLQMDRSFNTIWRVKGKRRYLVLRLLGYVFVLVTGPMLLFASVTITTYMMALTDDVPRWAIAAHGLFMHAVTILTSAAAFFVVYRVVPTPKVPWLHALLGALVAATLFEGAKHVFGYMVRNSPTYSIAYGAFAAFPVFLIWMYISWMVVLFGAELTASAAYWHSNLWKHAEAPSVRFREALTVTQALIAAGSTPMKFRELQDATHLPPRELDETLEQMVDGSVIEKHNHQYALTAATREVLATRPKERRFPAKGKKVRKSGSGKARSGASSR
jgi:membrane protein